MFELKILQHAHLTQENLDDVSPKVTMLFQTAKAMRKAAKGNYKALYCTASLSCGNATSSASATLRVWYSTNFPKPDATCVSVTWM